MGICIKLSSIVLHGLIAISFEGWTIFHCLEVPRFMYPFSYWKTSWLGWTCNVCIMLTLQLRLYYYWGHWDVSDKGCIPRLGRQLLGVRSEWCSRSSSNAMVVSWSPSCLLGSCSGGPWRPLTQPSPQSSKPSLSCLKCLSVENIYSGLCFQDWILKDSVYY